MPTQSPPVIILNHADYNDSSRYTIFAWHSQYAPDDKGKESEVNMAYRWFIGYDILEKVPYFSTFGKNYTRRFQGTQVFERIFERILQEAQDCGFVDASAVFIELT